MNIILFDEDEIGRPLPRNDRRARHIIKVLKLHEGDRFSAGIVNGPVGTCPITTIRNGEISFDWQPYGGESAGAGSAYTDGSHSAESMPTEITHAGQAPVTLLIGMIRPIAAKRLLRDLTTIGIADIRFVRASMSEKSYGASTLWRDYRPHLIEGAEQAGTTALPRVSTYGSLREGLQTLPSGDQGRIVLRLPEREHRNAEQETVRPSRDTNDSPSGKSKMFPLLPDILLPSTGTVIAVGPERGWTVDEVELLSRNGFHPARLGSRILKTETACVAAGVVVCMKYDIRYDRVD